MTALHLAELKRRADSAEARNTELVKVLTKIRASCSPGLSSQEDLYIKWIDAALAKAKL